MIVENIFADNFGKRLPHLPPAGFNCRSLALESDGFWMVLCSVYFEEDPNYGFAQIFLPSSGIDEVRDVTQHICEIGGFKSLAPVSYENVSSRFLSTGASQFKIASNRTDDVVPSYILFDDKGAKIEITFSLGDVQLIPREKDS